MYHFRSILLMSFNILPLYSRKYLIDKKSYCENLEEQFAEALAVIREQDRLIHEGNPCYIMMFRIIVSNFIFVMVYSSSDGQITRKRKI